MKASQTLQHFDDQKRAIDALIDELDEVQVAFNAQYDEFKAGHDAMLDHLTDQIAGRIEVVSPQLQAAIRDRLPEERRTISERRQKVQEEYLPQRQQAAEELLKEAQREVAELRTLNPELDEREEKLKQEKDELEARLSELNEEIRKKSRGLGVVRHFRAITKADGERNRILGKLEAVNESLFDVRGQWKRRSTEIKEHQAELEDKWQLESIAVARLQSELDQLSDEVRSDDLAQRRATRYVLDHLEEPSPSSDPDLDANLREMCELNIQTDAYHDGLAAVGGLIGLLGGIKSGLDAIRESVEGLRREQEMHSAYLQPLNFALPKRWEAFSKQWPDLAKQFADEKTIGAKPMDFARNVEPLLQGPLSEATIEAVFGDLGQMIKQATAKW